MILSTKLITLLTDFGYNDVYVGVMKGVIAKINSAIKIIDLTHDIPPQNIAAARFNLMNAYSYFPQDTIHLAVVDPGVGSQRRAIGIRTATNFLVGPDNGLFSGVLAQNPPIAAVELTNSKYWRISQPSNTFHGRDIFAPVAAYLANGVNLQDLGEAIDIETLVKLNIPECIKTENYIQGHIQYIDHFGNLITNIPENLLKNTKWVISFPDFTLTETTSYSNVPIGNPLALIGSHGWLEIAINGGNAQNKLNLNVGNMVQIIII